MTRFARQQAPPRLPMPRPRRGRRERAEFAGWPDGAYPDMRYQAGGPAEDVRHEVPWEELGK